MTDATRCCVCGGEFTTKCIHIEDKQYHPGCAIMSHGSHTYEDYARLGNEIERLRKGIQDYLDGDYARPGIARRVDKCPHGLFGWDTCENCIDAHFSALLNPSESPLSGEDR